MLFQAQPPVLLTFVEKFVQEPQGVQIGLPCSGLPLENPKNPADYLGEKLGRCRNKERAKCCAPDDHELGSLHEHEKMPALQGKSTKDAANYNDRTNNRKHVFSLLC